MNVGTNIAGSRTLSTPNILFVAVALFFGGWLAWDAMFFNLVTYSHWADYWEHTATLTEWLQNHTAPGNPHAADPGLSPRYMPLFWVYTELGLLFGLNSIQLMAIGGVVNYILIVVGLWLFMRAYFNDPWAPFLGFIAVFMLWGISWNWSNIYQVRSFFYVGSYPSSFVFGLSLVAFWATLKVVRGDWGAIPGAFCLAMLAALMFLCHPLTGVFGVTGCGLLLLTEGTATWKNRFLLIAALPAGLLLAEIWPYFSALKLALGQYGAGEEKWFAAGESLGPLERFRSGAWMHIFYNPKLVLAILGPALLGIPVCAWLLIRREQLFIALGALAMSIPYLAHFFVEVPLAHRFLLFVAVYLQLALVWLALRLLEYSGQIKSRLPGRSLQWVLGLGIAGLVAFNIQLVAVEFRGYTYSPKTLTLQKKATQLQEGMDVVELYTKLTDPLPESAVVLATSSTGWPLPTVKGKVISLYHENPMLLDQDERYAATEAFFFRGIDSDQRTKIATRYSATHALVHTTEKGVNPGAYDWITTHGDLLVEVGNYRMYKLKQYGSSDQAK